MDFISLALRKPELLESEMLMFTFVQMRRLLSGVFHEVTAITRWNANTAYNAQKVIFFQFVYISLSLFLLFYNLCKLSHVVVKVSCSQHYKHIEVPAFRKFKHIVFPYHLFLNIAAEVVVDKC